MNNTHFKIAKTQHEIKAVMDLETARREAAFSIQKRQTAKEFSVIALLILVFAILVLIDHRYTHYLFQGN